MPTSTFELEGYAIKHTPTESSCNLKIYQTKELESNFIEILNQNSKSTIIGCIYQHPCMDPAEFTLREIPLYTLLF